MKPALRAFFLTAAFENFFKITLNKSRHLFCSSVSGLRASTACCTRSPAGVLEPWPTPTWTLAEEYGKVHLRPPDSLLMDADTKGFTSDCFCLFELRSGGAASVLQTICDPNKLLGRSKDLRWSELKWLKGPDEICSRRSWS